MTPAQRKLSRDALGDAQGLLFRFHRDHPKKTKEQELVCGMLVALIGIGGKAIDGMDERDALLREVLAHDRAQDFVEYAQTLPSDLVERIKAAAGEPLCSCIKPLLKKDDDVAGRCLFCCWEVPKK